MTRHVSSVNKYYIVMNDILTVGSAFELIRLICEFRLSNMDNAIRVIPEHRVVEFDLKEGIDVDFSPLKNQGQDLFIVFNKEEIKLQEEGHVSFDDFKFVYGRKALEEERQKRKVPYERKLSYFNFTRDSIPLADLLSDKDFGRFISIMGSMEKIQRIFSHRVVERVGNGDITKVHYTVEKDSYMEDDVFNSLSNLGAPNYETRSLTGVVGEANKCREIFSINEEIEGNVEHNYVEVGELKEEDLVITGINNEIDDSLDEIIDGMFLME